MAMLTNKIVDFGALTILRHYMCVNYTPPEVLFGAVLWLIKFMGPYFFEDVDGQLETVNWLKNFASTC